MFAFPCNFVAWQGRVSIGKKKVRRVIAGVGRQSLCPFGHRYLFEAKLLVDSRQACTARRAILIQEQPRSTDGPVVVELNRLLQIYERIYRTIFRLLSNGIVEPCGGIVRIELLGEVELRACKLVALFFVVSLAEITADQRRPGIEANRDLDFLPAAFKVSTANLGQSQTQSRQRIGVVELDRLLERRFRGHPVDAHEICEPEHGVRLGELRIQLSRMFCRVQSPIQVAGRHLELGQPRPRKRILGIECDGFLDARQRLLDPESRLLCVRERNPGRGRGRIELDRLVGEA